MAVFTALLAVGSLLATSPRVLRVCSDPNNLPFSNEKGEGFENKLAELIAHELGAQLQYLWRPQRRGFFRTLKQGECDLVVGVPSALDAVATTAPYYRSRYVFVQRAGARTIRSLDDPALRTLKIGVPLVGDDGWNPAPVHALAARKIVDNLIGYSVYGDYGQPNPPAALIEAVRRGEIDLAIAWGPLAGSLGTGLKLTPLDEREAPDGLPFAYDISAGVRRGDAALKGEVEAVLRRRTAEVRAILQRFGVPR
jgi:mxaJ protein